MITQENESTKLSIDSKIYPIKVNSNIKSSDIAQGFDDM